MTTWWRYYCTKRRRLLKGQLLHFDGCQSETSFFLLDLTSCYLAAASWKEATIYSYTWRQRFLAYAYLVWKKRAVSNTWLWNGLVMIPSTSILFVGKQLFYHATCCYSLDSFWWVSGRQQQPATTHDFKKSAFVFGGWMVGVAKRHPGPVRCTAVDFANSTGLVVY
jgi:hypothetical protein